jgi:hypothetical protein
MSEGDNLQRLVGDGYRLLCEGEARQAGDEFILLDTDGTSKYWPWDARFDAAIQGAVGPCKHTRRKIFNGGHQILSEANRLDAFVGRPVGKGT